MFDENPTNFFLKNESTNIWTEYKDREPKSIYEFVQLNQSDPIVFSKAMEIYAKIGDHQVVFSFNGIEGLADMDIIETGGWEIELPNELPLSEGFLEII